MSLQRSFKLGLGTVVLLLSVHAPSVAQTAHRVGEATSPGAVSSANYLAANPSLMDLPPIQPILPDVPAEPIRLVLKLGERRVYVYRGDALEASYPVAVGRPGWETPTGQFQVLSMLQNPGWTNPFTGEIVPPGPENPLGERWIAFWTDGRNYIGFHGTPNRNSVGRAASHGCIRMFNEDVRELYEIVAPGTLVVVEQ